MIQFVPEEIRKFLEKKLSEDIGKITFTEFHYSSGGCINQAGIIESNQGKFFIKWNDRHRFPDMFEKEFKSLQVLKDTNTVSTPNPLFFDHTKRFSFLLMECITPAKRINNFWEDFATQLAGLHRISADNFGLSFDNYIGSLPQRNNQMDSWYEFYKVLRVEDQMKLAADQGKIDRQTIQKIESYLNQIESIFPKEQPALIHGDLWSGNFMTGSSGSAVIFDPSTHFSHREMELSFTNLFGGYDEAFYQAYHEVYPLTPGFHDRVDFYNIYPLLVHVNLFGGSYISQVKQVLKDF